LVGRPETDQLQVAATLTRYTFAAGPVSY
jgi:hypothetical protein